MCVAQLALRCEPPLIRGVGRDLSQFRAAMVRGGVARRARLAGPVRRRRRAGRFQRMGRFRRTGAVPAHGAVPTHWGGSSAWGGSDALGRFQRMGRFRRTGAVPAHGAVPTHGRFQRMGRFQRTECAAQGQISDRSGCLTTQSRAQKDRCGRFTAGGWGTSQSPETRPPLGRCPGVLRSRDDLRVSVTPRSVRRTSYRRLDERSAGDHQPPLIPRRRNHENRTGRLLLPGGRALQRPDLLAIQRGGRRLSSSAHHSPQHRTAPRTAPAGRRYLTADDRPRYPATNRSSSRRRLTADDRPRYPPTNPHLTTEKQRMRPICVRRFPGFGAGEQKLTQPRWIGGVRRICVAQRALTHEPPANGGVE